jgi:hypothetical protein
MKLFCLFIAAGTKVSYQIVCLGFFEDISEGWHLFATVVNLGSDLIFLEPATHPREIGSFGASVLADGVALGAARFGEDLGPTDARVC